MVYNDTSTKLGICQEIDALCDSDTTSYPVADKTRRVNAALEELVGKIINADGTWEYDDTNYTDLPVGTGTLVEAQQSYSFASEYLTIEKVKVKTSGGVWQILDPLDEKELGGLAIEEYFTDTGMPTHYDIVGDTIYLYPAPTATSVTLASGLKVHFKRTAHLFTADDTTAEPGLPSPYHILLAYMAAIPYCMSYKQNRIALYEKKKDEMIKDLIKFYSHREADRKKVITMSPIQFR